MNRRFLTGLAVGLSWMAFSALLLFLYWSLSNTLVSAQSISDASMIISALIPGMVLGALGILAARFAVRWSQPMYSQCSRRWLAAVFSVPAVLGMGFFLVGAVPNLVAGPLGGPGFGPGVTMVDMASWIAVVIAPSIVAVLFCLRSARPSVEQAHRADGVR